MSRFGSMLSREKNNISAPEKISHRIKTQIASKLPAKPAVKLTAKQINVNQKDTPKSRYRHLKGVFSSISGEKTPHKKGFRTNQQAETPKV